MVLILNEISIFKSSSKSYFLVRMVLKSIFAEQNKGKIILVDMSHIAIKSFKYAISAI